LDFSPSLITEKENDKEKKRKRVNIYEKKKKTDLFVIYNASKFT
jgi:hypothetical protein